MKQGLVIQGPSPHPKKNLFEKQANRMIFWAYVGAVVGILW
jgi:hypothetical protein